jgi:hypothetical protein
MELGGLLPSSRKTVMSEALCNILWNASFLWIISSQAGGPPIVGSPQLLIEHIHSYPPYLNVVSSIYQNVQYL